MKMKNYCFTKQITVIIAILLLLISCKNEKREVPKTDILKAIAASIKCEKGFISLEDTVLLRAEEIIITNKNVLSKKQNYIVWKALAKVKHKCNGCSIQNLENNVAIFIITEDESKHFEAHFHSISLQGMNPVQYLMNKSSMEEVETTSRFTHIKGVELNDNNPYIWTNEEYSYPSDLRPTKFPIFKVEDINIDQVNTILEIKGSIYIVWDNQSKTLIISDAIAKRKEKLKKGNNAVSFDDYFNFVEGRKMKFKVD